MQPLPPLSFPGGTGKDVLDGDGSLDTGWFSPTDIASLDYLMTYAVKGYATSVTLENFTVVDAPEPGDDMLYGEAGNDTLTGSPTD